MTEDERTAGERWGVMKARVDSLMEWRSDAAKEIAQLRTDNATTKQRLGLIWSIMAALAMMVTASIWKIYTAGGL